MGSQCRDCRSAFTVTEGERAFFEEKGFSLPTRCSQCRQNRKGGAEGGDRGGRGGASRGDGRRQGDRGGDRRDGGDRQGPRDGGDRGGRGGRGGAGGAPWPMNNQAGGERERPSRRLSDENRGPRSPLRVKQPEDYAPTPVTHLLDNANNGKGSSTGGCMRFEIVDLPASKVPLASFQPRRQRVCRIVLADGGNDLDKAPTLATAKASIIEAVNQSIEAGGVVAAHVTVGQNLFVVPEEYVNERSIDLTTLGKWIEDRFVFPFFYPFIEQRCAHEDEVVNTYLTKTSHWNYVKKTRTIRVKFADLMIARMEMLEDKTLVPLEPTEEELAANPKLLAGQKLKDRVTPMKLVDEDDRIFLPPSTSKDIRVYGSKTLESQHNSITHHFTNATGWEGRVTVDTEIEHIDGTHTHRPVKEDVILVNVLFVRSHLGAVGASFTPADNGYPAHIVSFLRPATSLDYRLVIAEHAPPEEGEGPATTGAGAFERFSEIVTDVAHLMPVIDEALVNERAAAAQELQKVNSLIEKARIR